MHYPILSPVRLDLCARQRQHLQLVSHQLLPRLDPNDCCFEMFHHLALAPGPLRVASTEMSQLLARIVRRIQMSPCSLNLQPVWRGLGLNFCQVGVSFYLCSRRQGGHASWGLWDVEFVDLFPDGCLCWLRLRPSSAFATWCQTKSHRLTQIFW